MKGYIGFVIGLFAVVAAVAVGFWIFSGSDAPVEEEPTSSVQNDSTELDENAPIVELSEPALEVNSLEEWPFAEQAEADINEALEPGQVLGEHVLEINELGIAYLTTRLDQEDGGVLVSVYEYNLGDYSFNRIYKRVFGEGSINGIEGIPYLQPRAYSGTDLVFTVTASPLFITNTCNDLLLYANSSDTEPPYLLSLDVTNPGNGFDRYELSGDLLETATQAQIESCGSAEIQPVQVQ